MSLSPKEREENHKTALRLLLDVLNERAIDTAIFDANETLFKDTVLRTTWEELVTGGFVQCVESDTYRLTAKGWLTALEVTGYSTSHDYEARLGRLFAAMKSHVKGREQSGVVTLIDLSKEAGESEGWIFNVVDSKATTEGNTRTGATWFQNERGRLVLIPVDFNLEPIDVTHALTAQHLQRIEELEDRLQQVEDERNQYHCPYCDAELSGIGYEDYPEHHCEVTREVFSCGFTRADGYEEIPCPFGPHYPKLEEFKFITKQDGNLWYCYAQPLTPRAHRVNTMREIGRTEEEAEEQLRKAIAPRSKQDR